MTNGLQTFVSIVVLTNAIHLGRFIDDSTGRQWEVRQGQLQTNHEKFVWDGERMTASTNTDLGPMVGPWVLLSRGQTNFTPVEYPPPLPQLPYRGWFTNNLSRKTNGL
jgi:hypothetical protein